jgi:hypothetical protein
MQVLEWQEQAAKRATIATHVEVLLRVLRKQLPSKVPADIEQAIRATTDPDQLVHWIDAAAVVSTLKEFRCLAGLELKRKRRRKRSQADNA